MNVIDVLVNFAVMLTGIVVGSYIYTKLILKHLVRSEIKSIVTEVAQTLNSDGEVKDKIREIIDVVIGEVKTKGKEALIDVIRDVKKEIFGTPDVIDLPDFLKGDEDD